MLDSNNNIVDINGDGVANANDIAMLNLGNGSTNLYIAQNHPDKYVIYLKNGFYNAMAEVQVVGRAMRLQFYTWKLLKEPMHPARHPRQFNPGGDSG